MESSNATAPTAKSVKNQNFGVKARLYTQYIFPSNGFTGFRRC